MMGDAAPAQARQLEEPAATSGTMEMARDGSRPARAHLSAEQWSYVDAFCGEYLASLVQDGSNNWKLSDYTNPEQHRFRLFRKSPWTESFFTDDIFLEENATMSKHEHNTVDKQLCQLCATDTSTTTLMVEGISECYYWTATRQDVEIWAGIRVMDGRNSTTEQL